MHKAESLPFADIDEGDSIEGTFQGRKMITIKDRNTKLPKDIWVYRFADVESGTEFLLSGRTMLDQAFEELAQEEGGMEKLEGEDLRINRGDDERTGSGNDMGTYEIMILE